MAGAKFELLEGMWLCKQFLDEIAQEHAVRVIREVVREAPLFVPTMPRTGKPMRVLMTNCGALGWVTDKLKGYRYQETHPATGDRWPEIPAFLNDIWREVANADCSAEACLINYYDENARMGLHQDRDEAYFEAPVVSISLGDDCLFRFGDTSRGGKTRSVRLSSGDVIVMGGASRLCFHGVDRIYAGSSTLLEKGGRLNLTLRRVTDPMAPAR